LISLDNLIISDDLVQNLNWLPALIYVSRIF